MTVNLIPQDELTLDLLAEVLAKMYLFYLKNNNDAPDEVVEPVSDASSADPEDQPWVHVTAEADWVQVEMG